MDVLQNLAQLRKWHFDNFRVTFKKDILLFRMLNTKGMSVPKNVKARFLIFCQLWANAATKFQCNPMVLAVLSFSADTPFVTTRLRLWPHQFSHDHSNFLTAATISAQLSVVMHASFLSMNPHSLNEQRRDSDKLSSVWPSGKKLGLQTPALQLSFCIYDMHGQTHKWSHIKVGPHIRSGGK